MNNFYPTYKSKLKPWIKYWLLKKLNNSGESTLKVVTLSSGTLTKVDKSKSLSIKEYYGNTIQNGTPTPEAPVEIQTISGNNTFTINNNSYRVDLGNIELCKIGNYQDKLYYDSGKWYIEKNIGKVVYNGTENWYFTSNCCFTNNIEDTVKRPPNNNTKANIICDHYQLDTLANCYNNVTDKRISVNNGGYLYIYDTSFIGANAIKTWLTTNNVTVYYALATPTTTEITNTNLISQLNNLYEFYVQSNIVSISNNSEIQLEVLLEYYGR